MPRRRPRSPLGALLLLTAWFALLASSAAAQGPPGAGAGTSPGAPITVVAELSRIGGPWTACGRVSVVGAVEYRLLRVEQGRLPIAPGQPLVVAFHCPDMSFRESRVARLVIQRARPRGWATYQVHGEQFGTSEADRYFVVRAEPLYAEGHRRLLGRRRAEVAREHPETGAEAGGWVRHGPQLLVRYEGDRAVELRAGLPPGIATCRAASLWMGYPPGRGAPSPLRRRQGCEWPGISERHRLEPGVAAELRDGVFHLRRVPAGAR